MKHLVKHLSDYWKRETNLKKAADILGLLICFAGFAVSVRMNLTGRSLWLDEAMLAFSFSKRSLLNLIQGVFEWDQSAPVLYLYIVKILTLIFGNTEGVLRSFSVVSYAVALFLSGLLSKRLFGIKYPTLAAAFLANMNFILRYSNEFKQYLAECIWALLTLLVYYLYKEKGLAWWKQTLCFMVFIWGANPACFLIGGVLLYEFLYGIWKKEAVLVRNSVLTGVGVGVSFVLYFFCWLRGIALSGSMQGYWQNADFPLFPETLEDLKMAQACVYEIFITFREARIFMTALVIAAFLIGIFWEKNRYCIVILLGFFVALFASSIHMFPIADRLWCFSFPIFTILAFYAIDKMAVSSRKAELAALFLMAALILTNNGISVYRHAENVYYPGEEINPAIAYVQENIQEDEKVYVYYQSIPNVKYKIGYDTDRIGGGSADNIIWASEDWKDEENGDIGKVTSLDKCYLLISHASAERISPLLDAAAREGNLEIVLNEHETPLYFYSKSPKDMKARVSYELIDREDEDDTCYVTIRVKNEGASIINTSFDRVRIACREREEIGTNLWQDLMPGEAYDMPLAFDWEGAERISLQLCNEGKYWYEELGAEPITIYKGEG